MANLTHLGREPWHGQGIPLADSDRLPEAPEQARR